MQNKQYIVRSKVNEIVFQSFINNLDKESFSNICFDNLDQYEMLCNEFKYKENVIILLKKQPNYIKNQNLRNIKEDAFKKHSKIIKEYQNIIHTLFRDNKIGSFMDFLEIKNDLLDACNHHNLSKVELLTRKKILHKNGLIFALNKNDKTAGVFRNFHAKGDVLIPNSIKHNNQKYIVTTIHEESFHKSRIKTIIFNKKSQLQVIEKNAFCESSIETISIPSHVIQIGEKAFSECQNLRSVLFSEQSEIKTIGKYAFSKSTILENISLPSSVKELEEGWFYDTHDKLKITILPSKNHVISYYDGEFIIGKYHNLNAILFSKRNIKAISIPSFIQIIAPYAFYKCTKLSKFSFSKNSSLIKIGKYAFSYTSIDKITIPSSVKEIDDYAFHYCKKLKTIDFKNDSQLRTIGKNIIAYSSIKFLSIPSSIEKLDDLWIEDSPKKFKIQILQNNVFNLFLYENYLLLGKTNILNNAFDVLLFLQRNIEYVVIPSFITKISSYAFKNCHKLKNIEFLPYSQLISIESEAFANSLLEQITIPSRTKRIGYLSFYNCKHLKRIIFEKESELESIGKRAFDSSSIESISIPSSVVLIDLLAFQGCKNLKKLDFSSNLKSITISSDAFLDTFIECITFSPQITEVLLFVFNFIKQIKNARFETYSNSNMITIKIFPDQFYYYSYGRPKCDIIKKQWISMICFIDQIKKHSIQNTCISLIDQKFIVQKSNYKNNDFDVLVSVHPDDSEFTIPSFIKRIDFIYFYYIEKFKKINFPDNSKLQKIDDKAFMYSKIEEITIPLHVTIIGNYAFEYCGNLKKIVFSKGCKLEIIGNYAFYESSLVSVYFPKSVSKIQYSAFSNCKNLKNLFFPENSELKLIESHAFYGTAIENIQIPSKVTTIGSCCFNNNFGSNLKTIEFLGSNMTINENCFHKEMYMISFPNAQKIIFHMSIFSDDFSLFVSPKCIFVFDD